MRTRDAILLVTAIAAGVGLCACGGGGDGASTPPVTVHAPALSNLTLEPTRLPVKRGGIETVISTVDFVDTGGDIVEFRIAASDGSSMIIPATGLAGITSGRVNATLQVSVDNPVDVSFETWAIDAAGSTSNRLRGTFQIFLDDTASTWRQVASFASGGPTYGHSGLTWTGSQYLGVGVAGTVRTSSNARDWTTQPTNVTHFLRSIAWSGSVFVAVGNDPLTYEAIILSSTDGQSWTRRYTPPTVATRELNKVVWAGDRFVAVGNEMILGQEFALVLTSGDGLAWTPQAYGQVPGYMSSVAWSGSVLAAVGRGVGFEPAIWSSHDGAATWTRRDTQTGVTCCRLADIAFGNGKFVAVGAGNGSRAYSSADGVAWQPSTTVFAYGLNAVAVGATRYVAIGTSTLFTSQDGVTWIERLGGFPADCNAAILWDGKGYVAAYTSVCQSP